MIKKRKSTRLEWVLVIMCYLLLAMNFYVISNSVTIKNSSNENGIKYNFLGNYAIEKKAIIIFPDKMTWFESDRVYYHEKCHYYWFTIMTDSQRDEYTTMFNASTVWVSWYARTEDIEDFAETCAYYIFKEDYRIDKDRLDFLNKLENIRK